MDIARTNRSRLFIGTAGLALAAALAAAPRQAEAQAFNATETVIFGEANRVFSPGSTDEVITVVTPTAVIDWTPQLDNFGNALTFLPDGNTAIFQDAPGQGGFAVLNRVLPSPNGNIVAFDGRVVSRLQDAAGNFTPGGFVAFYSPTGILVGSTAVFDVGQLLLTTLDVNTFSFDAFYTQGGALNMFAAVDSTERVEILPGATINAPAEESFFVVAAPQIIMGGDATINGSTAYIAGTAVELSYNAGLFDIAIRQGTDVANAIEHTGSTGGPASTGPGDNHVIYGVARSETNPINLLFSGNLGFDPAVSALVENGDIILAANYDVLGTSVAGGDVTDPNASFFGGLDADETGDQAGSIQVGAGTVSSRLTAVGTGAVEAIADTGDLTFTDDVTLVSRTTARMMASGGNTLSVGGNARVDASNQGEIESIFELAPQLDAIGGTASISAMGGGTVTISGDALVQANGIAGADLTNQVGGSAAGGDAEIVSDGGTVDIGGTAIVSAAASGFETGDMVAGGTYAGGSAQILAQNGGALNIGADAFVDASANAAVLAGPGAQAVGATTGGTAQIATGGTGGGIDIVGSAFIDASAFGRNGGSALGVPGLVAGGAANLFVDANGTIAIGGDAGLAATARGHDNTGGGQGGAAQGGQAVIQSDGTSIAIGGAAVLDSGASGGNGGSGAGVIGGAATGGLSSIDASSGTIDAGTVTLDASAFAGAGGAGGDATGGRTQILAVGPSVFTLGTAAMTSFAFGGNALDAGGNGGRGDGGEAEIATNSGGSVALAGDATLVADGFGGDGFNGGAATSGLAGIYAITGSISVGGDLAGSAAAFGGDATLGFGGQGGDATGGTAFVQADGTTTVGASISVAGTTSLDASGFGGIGGAGDGISIAAGAGGIGRGGTFSGIPGSGGVFALAGRDTATLTLGGVNLTADGFGGTGGSGGAGQAGGAGGSGFGGTTQAGTFLGGGDGSVDGGGASYGLLIMSAGGAGGNGGAGAGGQGAGGAGQGGFAALLARGTAVSAAAAEIYTHGAGGMGSTGGGGTGGVSRFGVIEGGGMTLGSLITDASGFGGEGLAGNGGTGTGGTAAAEFAGTVDIAGDLDIVANGDGGSATGGAGGAGLGGIAAFTGTAGNAVVGGTVTIGARGTGGEALSAGENAGDGTGGTASMNVVGGATMDFGAAQVSAGGVGGSGAAAVGGDGTGGAASLTATGAGSAISITGFASVPTPTSPAPALVAAFGLGGDTNGGSGIGGGAAGGTALVSASAGGSITLADDGLAGQANYVIARAIAGNSSVAGGIGGTAVGGDVTAMADNGSLALGEAILSAYAEGGSSGNSGLAISGGEATGGTRTIAVSNGGSLAAALPGGGSGAQGGNGSGGGNGGDATGGANTLLVDGGTAILSGANSFFANATGGTGAIGGNANGGQVVIDVLNGSVVSLVPFGAEQGLLRAGSFNNFSQGGAGSTQGGDAVGDSVTVSIADSSFTGTIDAVSRAAGGAAGSGGTGGDATSSAVTLAASNSTLTLGDGSRFTTLAVGGDGATGGNAFGGGAGVVLDSGSDLIVGSGTLGLVVSDEASGGAGTTAGGNATGGSAGFTLLGGSTASANLVGVTTLATATGGDALGGNASLFAEANSTGTFGSANVSATATASGQAAGGTLQVVSESGALLDIGALSVLASDAFLIAAYGGDLALGSLTASAQGALTSRIEAIGGSIPITGTADIAVAGDLAVTTGQGGIIGGPDAAAPTAAITIDAGGTVSFAGDNDAQTGFGGAALTIASSELDIADGARIGAETLNLNVRGNGNLTVVGGDTEEAGYTLTQDEASRIDALDVRFSASSDGSASDDLLVRNLTISGSLDDGIRSLEIDAGIVRVEGTLAYVDAAATDSLNVFADRLEIVTPGGIGIVDPDGAPTGSFEFYGNDFWMADADTIAQLQADRNFAGRDELLATAAQGSDDPLGYLRAGDVEFYIFGGGSLLTRNTGSAETPGGITVTGSLSIETGQSVAPLDVFAYGRLLNPDGSFVTGVDFFNLVNFNRAEVTYLDSAEFNDCLINDPAACIVEPPTPETPPVVTNPTTITGPLVPPLAPGLLGPGPAETDRLFGLFFPSLIETSSPSETDLIDDPVTSGGDSALFGSSERTAGSEAQECELDENGADEEICDDQ